MLNLKFPPRAEDRIPLTGKEFVQHIVPVISLYLLTAYLARTQGTRPYRLLLFPFTLSLVYHAAVSFQPSHGVMDYIWQDYGHGVVMFAIAMRVIEWTFIKGPLRRNTSSKPHPVWDTFNLSFNLRGIGWSWSKGLPVPPDPRISESRSMFYAHTIVRALKHVTIYDALHYFVQLWGANSFGSSKGGSIFDPSLPQPWQYLRATAIASASGLVIAFFLDAMFDTATLVLFPLLPDPKSWPPLSHKVWAAQSLAELWGVRWHQSFRRSFIVLGALPLAFVFGRRVAPLGAFIWSGLLHDISMWCMGQGIDPLRVFGFFALMGFGCVLESVWTALTSRGVVGWRGRLWTYAWVFGWSNMLISPWLARGLAGSLIVPTRYRIGKKLVDLLLNSLTAKQSEGG